MGKLVVGVAVASSSLAGRKGSEWEKMGGAPRRGVVLLLRLCGLGLWGRREEVGEWSVCVVRACQRSEYISKEVRWPAVAAHPQSLSLCLSLPSSFLPSPQSSTSEDEEGGREAKGCPCPRHDERDAKDRVPQHAPTTLSLGPTPSIKPRWVTVFLFSLWSVCRPKGGGRQTSEWRAAIGDARRLALLKFCCR